MDPLLIVQKMMKDDLFSQWLNIKIIKVISGECTIKTTIEKKMTNGFKIAHGGICYSLADSCLAFAANTQGFIALTKKSSIKHLKKVNIGDSLVAHAFQDLKLNQKYIVNITNQHTEKVAELEAEVHYTSTKWIK
jgi:acyl-CoA thioesterase